MNIEITSTLNLSFTHKDKDLLELLEQTLHEEWVYASTNHLPNRAKKLTALTYKIAEFKRNIR